MKINWIFNVKLNCKDLWFRIFGLLNYNLCWFCKIVIFTLSALQIQNMLRWCNLFFPQRITDWQDQFNKYSASKSKTSDGCVTWCNFTITLRIQNPDPSLDYGTYQLILQSYDSQSIPYDKLALNFTVPTHRTGIYTYYCCLIFVLFS